jgi:hypothetical protein
VLVYCDGIDRSRPLRSIEDDNFSRDYSYGFIAFFGWDHEIGWDFTELLGYGASDYGNKAWIPGVLSHFFVVLPLPQLYSGHHPFLFLAGGRYGLL